LPSKHPRRPSRARRHGFRSKLGALNTPSRSYHSHFESLEDRSLLSVTALGGEYQVNTYVTDNQTAPVIGSHPLSQQVVIAWVSTGQDTSGDGIYAQRYDLAGNTVGNPIRVNQGVNNSQTNPAIAMDALGGFVVAWQAPDGQGDGVFYRRFAFDGVGLSNDVRVNASASGVQQAPSVAMTNDGRWAIAFQSTGRDLGGNAVMVRRYAANGNALGNDFLVNATNTTDQMAPAIGMDSTGQFVVAWQSAGQDGDGTGIYARRYDANGAALAAEFVVNQTTSGNQSAPSIGVNADHSFVVAWQSAGQDASGDGIVARRYNASGAAIANEFLVNQFTTGNQSAPSVSSTTTGGFSVAWQSAGQDTSGDAVVARKYTAAGAADGSEFVVNTFVTGNQAAPAAAVQPDGDLLVAWQSPGQESGGGTSSGIFARRYTAANDAPVLEQISNRITDVGGTITFTALAIDQDSPVDTITYTLAPGAPTGATIHPSSGAFSWNTTGLAPGRYFVTVVSTDTAGASDTKDVAMTVFAPGERTALDDFVNNLDPTYNWDIRGRTVGSGYTKYDILLTSGTWRTAAEVNRPLWQHWMTVYVPDVVTRDRALLFIDGGSHSTTPPGPSDLDTYAPAIAAATGAIFVDLKNVPSQPLQFAGESFSRSEDAILAYSWRKYLETGDETWPVHLAMTRAAVRAMDALSDFFESPLGGNHNIESFVVAGGSKRGWTTWLSAAVDPRVSEIVPIVADLLNMEQSFVNHYAYYDGSFSPAVDDYVGEGILDVNNFGSEGIHDLLSIVDPYTYRDRLTLPKYLVNASGDEFFTPNSWEFYYDDLPGPKSLRYLPNTGHGVSNPAYIIEAFGLFLTYLNEVPLPQYSFEQLPDGTIQFSTSETVNDVRLWRATNPTKRDFRYPVIGSGFTSTVLSDLGGGIYQGNVPTPSQGWTAYFIEATVASGAGSLKVTTGIYIKGPPINEQPQIVQIEDLVVVEGSPLALQFNATNTDPGQTLSYMLEPGAPAQISIHPTTGLITGGWNDQVAGPYQVTATVWDNGLPALPNKTTFLISVINAAPTAGISGPAAGLPGGPLAFTLSATDPSSVDQAAGFTYFIDWDGDGTIDQVAFGPSGTVVNHTFAPGNFQVRVIAIDKDGGTSEVATHAISLNQAPVDPQNQTPYSIFEGGALALAATGWTDPDGNPLSYAWDVNGDLDFSDATGPAPTLTWLQLQALGIGIGTFNVRVRVSDGNGGVTTSAPVELEVLSALPAAGIAGPTEALRGEARTFTLTATTAGPTDPEALFTFTINWGDGSPVEVVQLKSGAQIVHRFNTLGTSQITVTATDASNVTGSAAAHSINTQATQLRANEQNPALVDLVWGGATGADAVRFEQLDATTIRITETLLNGLAVNNAQDFSGITGRVIGLASLGNDELDATGLITKQATLDGGGDNNKLLGGPAGDILIGGSNGGEGHQGSNVIIAGNGNNTIYGNDVVGAEGSTGGNHLIVGGSGDDTIYGTYGSVVKKDGSPSLKGKGGKNLIIGGGGSDTIYAAQSADGAEGGQGSLLISGTTTHNQAALVSILAEWTSARTYEERVANITGAGTDVRANGDNFFVPGLTLDDDDAADTIYSNTYGSLNWLFLSLDDDASLRVKAGELISDLP